MKNPCVKCKLLPVCPPYSGMRRKRKLKVKFTQLFCRHEYEREYIKGGFLVKDGCVVEPYLFRCKKCGKVRCVECQTKKN